MLRAAVSEGHRLERVRLVGDDGAGKFGMDAADLLASARRAVASPHLELLGLHAFGASNVLDAGGLADHVATTVATARELARAVGATLRLVDAGGGLGIPYEPHQESLDLVRLGAGLHEITAGWVTDPVLREARLLLEPGRFLVGPAGAYLARVVDRKTVDGSIVVILDGGVHHVLRPALVGQEHRIRSLGTHVEPPGNGRLVPVTVAGPLCSGLDVFSQAAVMSPPEVGDLLAILDVGAYGFTESMPLFLSHPIPAEVAVHRGQAALIRPRVDPRRWLAEQTRAGLGCPGIVDGCCGPGVPHAPMPPSQGRSIPRRFPGSTSGAEPAGPPAPAGRPSSPRARPSSPTGRWGPCCSRPASSSATRPRSGT